ncbi:hypothetical protein D3C71_930710 [compost metagenome]
MKHLFTSSAILLIFIFSSYKGIAQEKGTNEFYAGVGLLSTNAILDLGTNILVTGFSAGHINYQNNKSIPAIGIGYKIAPADRWMIGLDMYYESSKSDVYFDDVHDGIARYSYLTIGLGTDYHYISSSWFQMYSGLAIAYSFQNGKYKGSNNDIQNTQQNYINFHLNALGFRFGKTFAVFAELGFGYKGLIHAGLSLQL